MTRLRSFAVVLSGVVAMAALFCATQASATIIYQDGFNDSAGQLHGTTPDTTLGQYGGTSGATWTSRTGNPCWSYNSSYPGEAVHGSWSTSAYLPFAPQTGHVYTLSADLNMYGTGSGEAALGYMTVNSIESLASTLPYGVWRYSFSDLHAKSSVTQDWSTVDHGAQTAGYHTFTTILDTKTNPTNWSVEWKLDGTSVRTYSLGNAPGIIAVGMSAASNVAVHADNFTLTTNVPEPSSCATLLVAGLIGLLAYAWRKRK
jgi:hypothetical protein